MPTLDDERQSAGFPKLTTLQKPVEEESDVELVEPQGRDCGKVEPLNPLRRLLWRITKKES